MAGFSFANIHTIVVFTSFCISTFFIPLAFTLSTFLSGITKRSSRTSTSTCFCPRWAFWGTNSSGSARSRVTRVRFFNTFLVVANITGATVGINCTFGSASCDGIRFGDQTSQASANGVSKFVRHTHSSGSTWAWVTRIWFQDAFLVFTDVVTGSTIRVNNTLRFAASNGVGVGDQTGFTSANWVSAGSNGANSSRTARAGITRVRSLNTFLLFTNVISGAIGVNNTFGSAPSNGIGFGD